ncbi:MAG: hypothetical protein KAJ19_00805, partial [Gammaproteobacteria bacterium]|nr:hypothetical protein [Gammaproteobacteria bacterium]
MKTLIRSICLICMFNLISAQTQWVRYGDAPVLELGPAGSWEDYYVTTPYIIEVDDTLRMWYGGCEDANENYAIGYAWSIDGITWTKWDNNPVLEVGIAGSWDAKRVAWPEVQYQNGEYIMWYSGKGNANPYDRLKIGVARASDPVHWVKDTNNPVFEGSADGSWDDKHVVVFCVEYDGSEYTMWYSGRQGGGHYQIGRSFSADGVTNWLRDSSNPIIPNGAVGEWDYQETWGSSLYRVGELVEIFYSGVGTGVAIGLATSSDGDNFTKYPGNPIFEHGSSGSWDDYSVSYPSVGYDSTSTTFRIWYVGNDGQHAQIGYATSTHTDVAGGPVSGTWTLA